ncbi:hypothetical protein BDK51DRAFT_50187 [Blyttiomyces helicus]|uniref:WSC domain-containing protein n=1 Tax=Blyttiomyces helicus TaxID=388810 RepID=A0A4P9WG52_9FUNG|nr:hypothetical protein BDK51DRAFT_50187 [Blyttiomyces helicus]|eukprot:RKO91781.1 hypothetical protein BDK51DRAFT_50187 [Blyttiomyces helicus]
MATFTFPTSLLLALFLLFAPTVTPAPTTLLSFFTPGKCMVLSGGVQTVQALPINLASVRSCVTVCGSMSFGQAALASAGAGLIQCGCVAEPVVGPAAVDGCAVVCGADGNRCGSTTDPGGWVVYTIAASAIVPGGPGAASSNTTATGAPATTTAANSTTTNATSSTDSSSAAAGSSNTGVIVGVVVTVIIIALVAISFVVQRNRSAAATALKNRAGDRGGANLASITVGAPVSATAAADMAAPAERLAKRDTIASHRVTLAPVGGGGMVAIPVPSISRSLSRSGTVRRADAELLPDIEPEENGAPFTLVPASRRTVEAATGRRTMDGRSNGRRPSDGEPLLPLGRRPSEESTTSSRRPSNGSGSRPSDSDSTPVPAVVRRPSDTDYSNSGTSRPSNAPPLSQKLGPVSLPPRKNFPNQAAKQQAPPAPRLNAATGPPRGITTPADRRSRKPQLPAGVKEVISASEYLRRKSTAPSAAADAGISQTPAEAPLLPPLTFSTLERELQNDMRAADNNSRPPTTGSALASTLEPKPFDEASAELVARSLSPDRKPAPAPASVARSASADIDAAIVVDAHDPRDMDEIALELGDDVVILELEGDGRAYVVNLRSGKTGCVPLEKIAPRASNVDGESDDYDDDMPPTAPADYC